MARGILSGNAQRKEPTVVAVNISAGGIPKRPVSEARVTFEGLQDDLHEHEKHRRTDRAVSIQDLEILDILRAGGYAVGPGLMGENLTVRDLHVQSLRAGDRLRFEPDVVLELTSVRKPCFVLDQIDPRLKDTVVGRCGYMAKVIATGALRPGQTITVQRTFAGATTRNVEGARGVEGVDTRS
jgi:MOSC domain-containing protein YiiM